MTDQPQQPSPLRSPLQSIDAICAAAGSDIPSVTRPLVAPIYQSSVFQIESLEQIDDIYEGREEGFIYSRDANPNVSILERVIAQLEGADDAVAFASGMGAMGVTLLSMLKSGDSILAASDLYGGTNTLLRDQLSRLGVRSEFVDATDLDAVETALNLEPALVVVESITNPLLRLSDVQSISRLAHERGARVAVDNTLATPLLLRPLDLGADVAIHSTTKFLGGHSDVTGGAVAARADLAMQVRLANRGWGNTLDPFAAWLITRGLRTLPLRIQRACDNAMHAAGFLAAHPKVSAVHYPGLPDHPQRELARSMFGARFGHMVSFEFDDPSEASTFVRSLRMIALAPSLGEARTTISHPAKTSHRALTPAERAASGIHDGLIRMSCGIESAQDIITDLARALG